jgi:DNA replication and repair protein RecF
MDSVHLVHLRLRDFRNYQRLEVEFRPGFHLLLGGNAQGKTNLLEAIYLIATLRSFRGVGGAQLVRQDASGYFVGATIVGMVTSEVKLYWSVKERRLSRNGTPVKRLADYWGTLRAVVFCTEDLALIKGTARIRRRFLDLLLAQTTPGYLETLLRYTQALRSRNALLKQQRLDEDQMAGFTQELVGAGEELMRERRALAPRIAPRVQAAFHRISEQRDTLQWEYSPQVEGDFPVALAASRARERALRTTVVGPHRDDIQLLINGRSAAQYSSEGQKRTLALALKMAQAEHLTEVHGAPPILLIDDVMGELDANRRAGFLPLLDRARGAGGQVFMTCTEENWPRDLASDLSRWQVRDGQLHPRISET